MKRFRELVAAAGNMGPLLLAICGRTGEEVDLHLTTSERGGLQEDSTENLLPPLEFGGTTCVGVGHIF